MATLVDHTLKTIYCERVGQTVSLVEERIYPHEILPDAGGTQYQAKRRRCSEGIDCNLAGYSCRWSGLNPDYDPFDR